LHLRSEEGSQAAHPGCHDRVKEGGEDEFITVMLNPIQGIKHVNYTLDLLLYRVEQGKTCLGLSWVAVHAASWSSVYTFPVNSSTTATSRSWGLAQARSGMVLLLVAWIHTQPGNVLGGAQISGIIDIGWSSTQLFTRPFSIRRKRK